MVLLNQIKDMKKNSNNPNAKVFIIKGGYKALRDQLIAMGHIENPDPLSQIFEAKITVKKKDIDYDILEEF